MFYFDLSMRTIRGLDIWAYGKMRLPIQVVGFQWLPLKPTIRGGGSLRRHFHLGELCSLRCSFSASLFLGVAGVLLVAGSTREN